MRKQGRNIIRSSVMIFIMTGLGVFPVTGNTIENCNLNDPKPEPQGWFAGDIHVHRSCNGSKAVASDDLLKMMEENDLAVISVLSDMGNSEAPDRIEDLVKVDGKDSPLSTPGRMIHYSAEWHWDANEWERPHQALGGHIVLLGLRSAHKIWEESTPKILEWAKKQDAVAGFAHMQYLNGKLPGKLNCCIPVDYPVEAALGTIDFVSEDCNGGDSALEGWYKLLNCGIRMGLAAGTDYPCNGGAPLGSNLTYCNIPDDKLTYRKWIEAIRDGRTVISRNGHNEFLELKVNKNFIPGDEIKLKDKGIVDVEIVWTANKELTGRIELVCGGKVIAMQEGTVRPGTPVVFHKQQEFNFSSGWLCARRMDENGHQTHTSPVYVIVSNKPIRASAEDAEFFVSWIDNILKNITPGGLWGNYYKNDLELVQNRYSKARAYYKMISEEAEEKR